MPNTATFSELISGAQFRADLLNSNRVLFTEWRALLNEAIRTVWNLAAGARADFQFAQLDFAITSGSAASFAVPTNFHSLIDVVYSPDTTSEYSLGPYAWQNRRSPGGWTMPFTTGGSSAGATQARLMGGRVYLEPSLRAGGTYRCWYCPQPTTAEYIVRLCTPSQLPAYTAAGGGPGKSMTANANGALSVDGVAVAAGDRILQTQGQTNVDNGIYTVTAAGSGGAPWILTRASDFAQTGQMAVGDTACITEGTTLANTFKSITTFGVITTTNITGIIDTDPMVWTNGNAPIDAILNPFRELIETLTAIPAVVREGDAPTDLRARAAQLTTEVDTYFATTRSKGPQKIIDTDAVGGNGWGRNW